MTEILYYEYANVTDYLEDNNFEFIDNRNHHGALWVVGDQNISDDIEWMSDTFDLIFHYCPHGGNASRHRPSWWTSSGD